MIKYLRLIKFSHTIFSFPFALVGYFEGVREVGFFSWYNFFLTFLALILARTAAMSFNRWIDRDIDALNPRTQIRDIPSGKVHPREALLLTILASMLFLLVTSFINELTFILGPLALFVILGYSYTKRFTILSHFVLGLSLSMAPAGGYIAASGNIDFYLLWLIMSVVFWVAGFDIIYALQDEEFDRKMNLFSIPVRFGRHSLVIAFISHVFAMFFLFYFCMIINHEWVWTSFFLFSLMLFVQHVIVWLGYDRKVHLNFGLWNGMASVTFGIGYLLFYFFA
ncbi:MAG: putative 4-hydroxybenzoate polyprenyltransferase [Bacteroidales bacterium]|nr:putative 4-hydroxybenzoate polyprenyltransferase [Bacteroidales bacterium]